jgi:hypothetical protein
MDVDEAWTADSASLRENATKAFGASQHGQGIQSQCLFYRNRLPLGRFAYTSPVTCMAALLGGHRNTAIVRSRDAHRTITPVALAGVRQTVGFR